MLTRKEICEGGWGEHFLVLRPAPKSIANAVIHLTYWTCNYYGGAGRNITFSYWRRWRASVSKAHQIRRTDRCLKRPSLSKKFAYKPSFIAAVRVNVSDLTSPLNKGNELFGENAKNKAFLKVATLVADHSAPAVSILGVSYGYHERSLPVKCSETDLIE